MYFDIFKTINYPVDGEDKVVTNILTSNVMTFPSTYLETYVINQQKPHELSDELYGTTEYYWVLMEVNNIVNPYYDWPMTDEELVEYCKLKYGDINATHHYVDPNSNAVLDNDISNIITNSLLLNPNATPVYPNNNIFYADKAGQPILYLIVSNFGYESAQNAKKKNINIVSKGNILSFINSYKQSVKKLTPQ